MLVVLSIVIAITLSHNYVKCESTTQIQISTGIIKGNLRQSRSGSTTYSEFLGIPYGQVKKRFEISTPASSWEGVKETVDSGPGCVTSGFYGKVEGIENCLTLDVYVPGFSSTNLFPVMVWFYGGAFVEGGSREYNGSYFMDEDVIVVIPNYRLGPFGFLNAGVAGARGNQGLKDQVLALKWVQDNIGRLNGDKNKVTIFGESAGGISVSLLTLSPMAEGLFHRAIIQSGPAIIPFVNHGLDGITLAKKLGQAVDCPTSDMEYLAKCLQRLDPTVIAPYGNFINEMGWDESKIFMGPSIETFGVGENETGNQVFMSKDPFLYCQADQIYKVPIMMGQVSFESYWSALLILQNATLFNKMDKQWGRALPNLLFFSNTAEDPCNVSAAIRSHFFQSTFSNESLFEFEKMNSERHWFHPFRLLVQEYSKVTNVYLYNFTQHVKVAFNGTNRRVPAHADELVYLFNLKANFGEAFVPVSNINGDPDYELSKHMVKMWATFAREGRPGSLWNQGVGNWTSVVSGEIRKYLQIEVIPSILDEPENYSLNEEFWNSLSFAEYGKAWKTEPIE